MHTSFNTSERAVVLGRRGLVLVCFTRWLEGMGGRHKGTARNKMEVPLVCGL
jgi:hypothetical protein